MKQRYGILILTGIVTLLSIYFLSFSWVSRSIQDDAAAYAVDSKGNVDFAKRQKYLDSVWTEPVFNFIGLEYTYKQIKDQELQLGLDLQGGMHVVLEVSPVEIIRAMSANSRDPKFNQALNQAITDQVKSREKFLDLFYKAYKAIDDRPLSTFFANASNKGKIALTSTDAQVLKEIDNETESAIDRSFQILRTRIDKFGVTQPNIQRLKGTGRIQLELPGVDNPERVRKLLQGTAKLEFWEVWKEEEIFPFITQADKYLAKEEAEAMEKTAKTKDNELSLPTTNTTGEDVLTQGLGNSANAFGDSTAKDSLSLAGTDTATTDSLAGKASVLFRLLRSQYSLVYELKDTAKISAALKNPGVKKILPENIKFLWAVKPQIGEDTKEYVELYSLKTNRDGKAKLEGDVVTDAYLDIAEGKPGVTMKMNVLGSKKWKRLTGENIGRRVAIVLDGFVYSAPTVQSEIPNGNSSISGSFDVEEAKDLANILKAGKLPAPVRIVEEAIVGPTLGKEAINQGLVSSAVGLLLVVIFMIMYYNSGGAVADLALVFNVFFIMGVLAQMSAVLTLPGIAGIVLTIGMAVDANVLIFERIREELKQGRTLIQAVEVGYEKAFSSIFDSNVTTLLVGIILYYLGSGPIKGFAVTLVIGIFTSFFTSVFISKEIFVFLLNRTEKPNLNFSTIISKNLFRNIDFDVIGKRKIAYIFSTSIVILGIVSMVIQGGLNLGVDFRGGRYYIVKFNEPVVASDIRGLLADNFKNQGIEVKTFGANNQVKVTTSYLVTDESTNADNIVASALNDGLKEYNKPFEVIGSSKVGATVADDIIYSSYVSLLLALIGILLYVSVRFRKWQFGLGGVVALFHDAAVVVALYSIAGLFGISFEVDQVFIAAILTIIGYSINDTVVVFDRVREFTAENPKLDQATVFNKSILDTFSRTIMTAFTVFVVVATLLVFGGEVLRGFSFSMLMGVIFGSYSSIFIAVPIVLDFTRKPKETAIVLEKSKV